MALQGAFEAHIKSLTRLGVPCREVRQAGQLVDIAALVVPGGESTTMFMMLDRLGMREPLAELLEEGLPVFGTCAGAILMASEVVDGRADQWCFSAVDIAIRRNGYGRQIQSFEADLVAAGLDEPFRAPFIRAPVIESSGPQVEVLAQLDEHPVLVRQGTRVLSTFHPELTPDTRIHRLWLDTWG